jgi:Domain of unknown function (DUF1735)/Domain of unknown function (DUF4361)
MKKNTLKTILLGSLLITTIACSDDNGNITIDPNQDAVVSIAGTDAGTLINKDYKLNTARTDSFTVSVTSSQALTKDLSVNLGLSQMGLDSQNSKRKAAGLDDYTALPTSAYTISPNPVIIKAGTRTAKFALTANIPASIDLANDYLLPLGIISATDAKINGLLGFVNIGINGLPNKFAGDYRATGRFVIQSTIRDFDRDKAVRTIDKITSETEFADLGTLMWLKVNKDNTVTIIPQQSTTNLVGAIQQVSVNKYDPDTKTFTLNYQYNVGSRVITEVVKKK